LCGVKHDKEREVGPRLLPPDERVASTYTGTREDALVLVASTQLRHGADKGLLVVCNSFS